MAERDVDSLKQFVTARGMGDGGASSPAENGKGEAWLDELSEANEKLVGEFRAWLASKGRAEDDAERRGHRVLDLLELAGERDLIEITKADADSLRRFIKETVPRSACVKAAELDQQLEALESFFPFLQDTGRIGDATALQKVVKRERGEAVEAAGDPVRWDVYKLLYMRGTEAGHDMDDPEQVTKFVETLGDGSADSQELEASLRAAAQEEERYELPHGLEPIRRESPKVGRNDPCPCGSGQKYKKCCGN